MKVYASISQIVNSLNWTDRSIKIFSPENDMRGKIEVEVEISEEVVDTLKKKREFTKTSDSDDRRNGIDDWGFTWWEKVELRKRSFVLTNPKIGFIGKGFDFQFYFTDSAIEESEIEKFETLFSPDKQLPAFSDDLLLSIEFEFIPTIGDFRFNGKEFRLNNYTKYPDGVLHTYGYGKSGLLVPKAFGYNFQNQEMWEADQSSQLSDWETVYFNQLKGTARQNGHYLLVNGNIFDGEDTDFIKVLDRKGTGGGLANYKLLVKKGSTVEEIYGWNYGEESLETRGFLQEKGKWVKNREVVKTRDEINPDSPFASLIGKF